MKFRELMVGDTFDFIEDGSIYNSFYLRCTKTSIRTYTYDDKLGTYDATVGSINVEVHHVKPADYTECSICRRYHGNEIRHACE